MIAGCHDIRIGMLMTVKEQRFKVVKEGTSYVDEHGKRIRLDNRRKTKWYMQDLSKPEAAPVLMCFDALFDRNSIYEFSLPRS